MPHGLSLVFAVDGLLQLSCRRLQRDDESGAFIGGFPNDMPDVPHDDGVDRCHVQPYMVPADAWQFRRDMLDMSSQCERLFAVHLHEWQLPPAGTDEFEPQWRPELSVRRHRVL